MSRITKIPYENLNKLNKPFEEEFKSEFDQFLDAGWYILGKQVETFEKRFAEYCGVKNFCGLASGLDALYLALRAFGFDRGSEVIVPSNTYIATILAIVNSGLKPVLVEPDIRTYNINAESIEAALTNRTVAIMPVHLYGKCCDMERIMGIARARGLRVIEDTAQAHGATLNQKQAGTFGDFGAFSFYPTKNLGALGDAGGLTSHDCDLDAKIRKLRNYGSSVKYHNELQGVNSRLDELQACFLKVKLKKLDEITAHKRRLAKLYTENLDDQFVLPVEEEGYRDVHHIYNIRHPKRDQLRNYLAEHGIGTEIHYPVPPHQQKAMKGIIQGSYPISEEIHQTTLSLPISYCHSAEEIQMVIGVLNDFNA